MSPKPWVLVVSHVWPVPGVSGQEKRVYYMLKALRSSYNVGFLTFADRKRRARYEPELQELCDEAIVLPSRYNANLLSKLVFKGLGLLYSRFTGLKPSNFVIGSVELTSSRVGKAIRGKSYKAVIFEYWHAHGATEKSGLGGIPKILDMHNILWQTYKSHNIQKGGRSENALRKYKSYEEMVWKKFDHLIAINNEEYAYVKEQLGNDRTWYIPMGIDLSQWRETIDPCNSEPRIAFYGGLASPHNQRDAMRVYKEVMPAIWEKFPNTKLWIIGSKPPAYIVQLGKKDSRVIITGFLDQVAPVLGSMDLVLCPWEGTYGFRSRLVEVMATGTPVITTEDAATGMDLEHGQGILFNNDLAEWPGIANDLLSSQQELLVLRKLARRAVEERYSMQATYNRLPKMVESISYS